MIRKLSTNIIWSSLIVTLIFQSLFILPRKAEAQMAVVDAGAIKILAVIASLETKQAAESYSIWAKEYILDGLAYVVAEQILQTLTGSIVNWINSGFEGNPSFIGNPGDFFLDVGDQVVGDFLEKGGLTNFLCSPFSIDVRLSLAFRYQPFERRITCTLSEVISNVTGAVEGASINGFTAGDFRQGGFPAFISLTTEPQNNEYGAGVETEAELSVRVASAQLLKQSELNWGRGFLSWRDCSNSSNEAAVSSAKEEVDKYEKGSEDRYWANLTLKREKEKCPIQTPGSVIADQLNQHLGSGADKLKLADEFNEIVNALFAQLVKQVLTVGLGAVSGSGASDPSSYVNQIQEEQAANNQQLQSLKKSILEGIDALIKNENDLKAIKDISLGSVLAVQQSLENVKMCFSDKMSRGGITASQRSFALEQIGEADNALTERIDPLGVRLAQESAQADRNKLSLENIKRDAASALTVNEITEPTQNFQTLVGSGLLHNIEDILAAQNEQEVVKDQIRPYTSLAQSLERSCQFFPRTTIRP